MNVRTAYGAVGRAIFYNILTEFRIPPLHLPVEDIQLSKEQFGVSMELVRLTKVSLKLKPIVEFWQAIICLTCFLLGWCETQRCVIAIAFQLCLRNAIRRVQKKPGCVEIEWLT
jgi:hypothetical protein